MMTAPPAARAWVSASSGAAGTEAQVRDIASPEERHGEAPSQRPHLRVESEATAAPDTAEIDARAEEEAAEDEAELQHAQQGRRMRLPNPDGSPDFR
jgi:hypothetical protein